MLHTLKLERQECNQEDTQRGNIGRGIERVPSDLLHPCAGSLEPIHGTWTQATRMGWSRPQVHTDTWERLDMAPWTPPPTRGPSMLCPRLDRKSISCPFLDRCLSVPHTCHPGHTPKAATEGTHRRHPGDSGPATFHGTPSSPGNAQTRAHWSGTARDCKVSHLMHGYVGRPAGDNLPHFFFREVPS